MSSKTTEASTQKRPKGRPRNPDGATSSSALRAQQNREAALRYRARKDDQIRSLSARVALLEAENAQLRVLLLDHSITVPPSLSLPATAAPTGKQLPQVQQHQNQAALTPTIPANQTVILSPSSEWIDKPASEILGLPQAQAQETEVKKIRQHLINILRFKDKMLAACSPEELVRALEIMEHCKITNMQHMIHLYESGSISTKIAEQLKPEGFVGNDLPIFQLGTLYSPEVASFKESVIAAAASMTSFELLDELCDLFMAQAQCRDKTDFEEAFFRQKDIENKLLNVLQLEDRKRVAVLLQRWRLQTNLYQELLLGDTEKLLQQ
ncbi:hypothetical protein HDU84_007323 [Entophlyctis sp. JEL0112]|nr:hypothetical protein HDU84_007323 [Entophlyctis sp. JEL0112]